MTKLIAITFLMFVLSCRDNNSKQAFSPPDKKDISEIIKAVINRDSLMFLKDFKRTVNDSIFPLSEDLRKLTVEIFDPLTAYPPPFDHTSVTNLRLFNISVNHERFFDRIDSSYFLYQNDTLKHFRIDPELTRSLLTTTFLEQEQKRKANQFRYYYDLTIPIFSADKKKAYVELTRNCPSCGGATAYFLEKIKSKWTIVGWEAIWMN